MLLKKGQWKKWSLPSKITYIGFIITVLGAVFSIYSHFSNSKHNIITKVNQENVEYKNKTINKRIKYSIRGSYSKKIINEIEKSNIIKIVNNSKNIIEISYSGRLIPFNIDTNSFIYSGGNLQINVNGNCLYKFEEFEIQEMRPNSKQVLINEINSKMTFYLKNNYLSISKKIRECIKK